MDCIQRAESIARAQRAEAGGNLDAAGRRIDPAYRNDTEASLADDAARGGRVGRMRHALMSWAARLVGLEGARQILVIAPPSHGAHRCLALQCPAARLWQTDALPSLDDSGFGFDRSTERTSFFETFDAALIVDTSHRWSDPAAELRLLRRMLSDDARIGDLRWPVVPGMFRSPVLPAYDDVVQQHGEQLKHQLAAAGFGNIALRFKPVEPISAVCAVADKMTPAYPPVPWSMGFAVF